MIKIFQAAVLFAVVFCFLNSAAGIASAENDFDLETIVVTGTRIPASFSSATRNVTVIEREDIENAPVRS
ncbi:hypothetical protein KJ633_01420, partial [bacterium]|nr:hypothetical protein [bacterium]